MGIAQVGLGFLEQGKHYVFLRMPECGSLGAAEG
jgi:hypothetical protein